MDILYKYVRTMCALLFGALMFAACSNDEDTVDTPSFPAPVALECAGGEAALSFTVDRHWTLNSNKIWCGFKDGETVRTAEGGEGQHTVTVVVNADAQNFTDATADIQMTMDGVTKTVATVNRSAKGYEVKVYGRSEDDVIDAENHPFTLSYNSIGRITTDTINVVANFDWTIDRSRVPEWLSLPADKMTGRAGQVVTMIAEFKEGAGKVRSLADSLYVMDQAGVQHAIVKGVYGGMPADAIEFGGVTGGDNQWNWIADKDGWSIWQSNSTTGEKSNETDLPYNFTVSCAAKVIPVYMEENADYGGYKIIQSYPGMAGPWFEVLTDDDGYVKYLPGDKVSFSITENDGAARGGMLVLLPEKVYEETSNGNDLLDESDYELKTEYEKYVAVSFVQEGSAVSNTGFTVLDGSMTPVDDIVSALDQGIESETLINMYGTDNVWMWNPETSIGSAFISANGYTGGAGGEVDYTFDNLTGVGTQWPGLEISNMSYPIQYCVYIGFTWSEVPVGKEMDLTFKDASGKPYAVLVMTRISERYRMAKRVARLKAEAASTRVKAGVVHTKYTKANKKGIRR